MSHIIHFARGVCSIPGKISGWLILPLIASVCVGIVGAQLGINQLLTWQEDIFILGNGITLNTFQDMQWYIFACLVMFGGVNAYIRGKHVKVDLFSGAFSDRTNLIIHIVFDLLFLLPVLIILLVYGYKFTATSFMSGESSTYGGLHDRWVIKSVIPLSALLFILALTVNVIEKLKKLFIK